MQFFKEEQNFVDIQLTEINIYQSYIIMQKHRYKGWVVSNIYQDSHMQQTVNYCTFQQQILSILSSRTCAHRFFSTCTLIIVTKHCVCMNS